MTAIAVLSMALGIGVNTTAFGVLYTLVLRPLPYADPERVVDVSMEHPLVTDAYGAWSYPDYRDLRTASTVFTGVAAQRGAGSLTLAGPEGPERIDIDAVSANLFPLLSVDPILGRHFLPEEDRPDRPLVLLLSHQLWQRRFHGDPGVVGRTVIANGKPHRIVGVMPPGFLYPNAQEAWVPLESRWAKGPRTQRILRLRARLRPGVPLAVAQAEVRAITRRLARRYPESNAGWSAEVIPLRSKLLPPDFVRPFFFAAGAAGGVLLLACANVASLLLADAGGRRRELAIRAALGASRGRIVRQLLTENVFLALAGGLLGMLLAVWGLGLADRALDPVPLDWIRFPTDAPVLLFALVTSVASGLLFGLVPAVQATRIELRRTLKDGDGGRRGPGNGQRLRSALVIGEVAVALVLLIGASLFARSFLELRHGDPGFTPDHVVSLWTTLQGDAYATVETRGARAEEIARRVAAVPGIQAAAVGPVPLFGGSLQARIGIEGKAVRRADEPAVPVFGVTPGYFRTLGIPLLQGRSYDEAEAGRGERLVVINRAFAERYLPGVKNPVGLRLRLTDIETSGWMLVTGVAGDTKVDLWKPPQPQIYVPLRFEQLHTVVVLVRTSLGRDDLTQAVWKEIRQADPTLPIYNVQTIGELLDGVLAVERTVGQGLALFGAIALFLASVGIYGVLSCTVSQRLRELGVRIALGARRRDVLALVLFRGFALAAAGVALGLVAALALGRVVDGALYQVSPTDPASFATIPLLLLAFALAACWGPARRAMDADPVEAIRSE